MGHKNKRSIIGQVEARLTAALAIGQSRHADKRTGADRSRVYSWGTFKTYLRQGCRFAQWAKTAHGCTTLPQAERYAGEYLADQVRRGLSPSSVKTAAAALGKLYGVPGDSFGAVVPLRRRAGITRSRGPAARDAGFSRSRNADLVALCECVGLRRAEIVALTGDKLRDLGGGRYAVLVDQGSKGGRERLAPVVGPPDQVRRVVAAMQRAGSGPVFQRVNSHADIHGMRAVYAARVYREHARPLGVCKSTPHTGKPSRGQPGPPRTYRSGVYWCRGDRRGVWYDREAMRATSEALGHSRLSVVAEHYLYSV